MADVKQILVVDDHFEMLEFLRSMLELSEQGVEVLGVPSAEEAYLELRRVPFDLLITDVRLPGMSGFELVRRVKTIQTDLPIIMITAYSSSQGEREATDLGVFRYFRKPLNTDALLSSVKQVLYRGEEIAIAPKTTQAVEENVPDELMIKIERVLATLKTDTGARQVVLANIAGEVVASNGHFEHVDVAELAGIVGKGLETNFRLAESLGEVDPFAIQYQKGSGVDLYTTTVGNNHIVLILFEAKVRRGRIGTVWVFAQRLTLSLAPLVADLPALARVETEIAGPLELVINPIPVSVEVEELVDAVELVRDVEEVLADVSDDVAELDVAEELPPAGTTTSDDYEELEPIDDDVWETLGNDPLVNLFDSESETSGVDLEAFWDEALTENKKKEKSGELTFDEALRQGLISFDWDTDSE